MIKEKDIIKMSKDTSDKEGARLVKLSKEEEAAAEKKEEEVAAEKKEEELRKLEELYAIYGGD